MYHPLSQTLDDSVKIVKSHRAKFYFEGEQMMAAFADTEASNEEDSSQRTSVIVFESVPPVWQAH